MRFGCIKCSHEWDPKLSAEKLLEYHETREPINCPACAEKKTGVLMTQCPNCKALYVREADRQIAQAMKDHKDPPPPSPDAPPPDKCPKCGVDRLEWFKEHAPQP